MLCSKPEAHQPPGHVSSPPLRESSNYLTLTGGLTVTCFVFSTTTHVVIAMETDKNLLVLQSFPYAFFIISSVSEGDFWSKAHDLMFARCSEDGIEKSDE
ncbi:hypothetical protein TNCV_5082751 [Trichonephila clavipes]|nr:hypothetical protein TNCV_5082751 [Trichonephila clavipes]